MYLLLLLLLLLLKMPTIVGIFIIFVKFSLSFFFIKDADNSRHLYYFCQILPILFFILIKDADNSRHLYYFCQILPILFFYYSSYSYYSCNNLK